MINKVSKRFMGSIPVDLERQSRRKQWDVQLEEMYLVQKYLEPQ